MRENEKLIKGNTYDFCGYKWIVTEVKGNCAILQSYGVTSGEWPGYKMPRFGNCDFYEQDIDDLDISKYDDKMSELYDALSLLSLRVQNMGMVCT